MVKRCVDILGIIPGTFGRAHALFGETDIGVFNNAVRSYVTLVQDELLTSDLTANK